LDMKLFDYPKRSVDVDTMVLARQTQLALVGQQRARKTSRVCEVEPVLKAQAHANGGRDMCQPGVLSLDLLDPCCPHLVYEPWLRVVVALVKDDIENLNWRQLRKRGKSTHVAKIHEHVRVRQ